MHYPKKRNYFDNAIEREETTDDVKKVNNHSCSQDNKWGSIVYHKNTPIYGRVYNYLSKRVNKSNMLQN